MTEMQTALNQKIDFEKVFGAEPEWLRQSREQAWACYNDSPLPERVAKLWRYTKPEHFVIDTNGSGLRLPDAVRLAQIGDELRDSGVLVDDLGLIGQRSSELARGWLGRLVPYDFGKFESLNMALWNTGIVLYVPDNASVERPIHLSRHATGEMTVMRLLAVIGQNAAVTIVDDYSPNASGESRQINSVIEIYAGDSAKVRYVNLQRLGAETNAFVTQRTQLGANAESHSVFISLGGAVSKINAGTILDGRGSQSYIYGVVLGRKRQHFDHHTYHHHAAPYSTSNIDLKVVLKDKAVSAYTGLIKIEEKAINCEAYQENRNLLLDKGAKAETIPELEILTDQVRCTHGATVGPVDPEMVFYLKSRGLSGKEAIRLIVEGFIRPTIDRIPRDLGPGIENIVFGKLED